MSTRINDLLTGSMLGQNVCLSGGADGADCAWGAAAAKAGHTVIHWTFEGHRSKAPANTVVRLTEAHLKAADDALRKANRTLQRKFPTSNAFTNNLLRRNYYQEQWSQALYGVADIDAKGLVEGGTAWAVQMFLDRMAHQSSLPAYVFDQRRRQWFRWHAGWVEIDRPPRPEGIYAAIGSRKLTAWGEDAIKSVYT